jgi:hypothetical protein
VVLGLALDSNIVVNLLLFASRAATAAALILALVKAPPGAATPAKPRSAGGEAVDATPTGAAVATPQDGGKSADATA